MLTTSSTIGSLVSTKAYVIWRSEKIIKDKVSDRKEMYAITVEGLLFKATLWAPLSEQDIVLNKWVELKNFKVNYFKGKNISSIRMSSLQPVDSLSEAPQVVDYFGGIQIEGLPSLKSKTLPGNPFGHSHQESSMLSIIKFITRPAKVAEEKYSKTRNNVQSVVHIHSVWL